MFNTIFVKTGHVVQATKLKLLKYIVSQGHTQVGIKNYWYEFVKHLLYFVESVPALNEFLYLLLKSCL